MGAYLTTTTEKPRIYVACLAAYNSGYLHGAWIDAAQDAWSLWDDVQVMLASSPVAGAEEFAIHDYEGFGPLRIAEYTGLGTVAELAAFIVEHGELGAALLDYHDGDLAEARAAVADRYLGAYASLADYMQDVTEEAATVPASLRYYIDWQALARDAEMSGDLFTVSTAMTWCMCSRGADMEQQTYRLTWQGIEIEAIYHAKKHSGIIAHLEIRSIQPERAPLPIASTGYLSHFHQPGTVEALGGDVVAQVIAWLDDEAAKPEWRAFVDANRQGFLF